MTHPDLPPIDELLAGHALGDLDENEQEALRQHLAADPTLQLRLDELSTTLQLLPLGLPAQGQPPEQLRRRLFDVKPGQPERPPNKRAPLIRRATWSQLVMASLVVGLVFTGFQVQQLRRQLAQRNTP